MQKIAFKKIAKEVDEPWQPQDVAYINETALRLAKIHGAYDWHVHRNEDEFFLVIKGTMFIDTEKESVKLQEGDGLLVKRGIKHRSRAEKPAWVLLVEPTATKTLGEQAK